MAHKAGTDLLEGLVVQKRSGFYTVLVGAEQITCSIRKKVKRSFSSDRAAVMGDRVLLRVQLDGHGTIEEVLPRKSSLVRLASTPGGKEAQVILANPDQVILIFACANPEPHLRMLDRFLVICERQKLPVIIVANKTDLVSQAVAEACFGHYRSLGYPLVFTSACTGQGIEELHQRLVGKLSPFTGPSGVGKSSLLNAIQPGLGLAVGAVSEALNKGKHTTVARHMFSLEGGGVVVDMPGIRQLALWDTDPEELDGYFPELRNLVKDCQFNDCTHIHEPGCAIRQAVEDGTVHAERYESYLRLRQTVKNFDY